MKIELHNIPIRKVIADYKDSAEEGVVAYGGKLNVRPKYQREFVYKDQQRNAVIETIKLGYPLNVMYWMETEDGNYEVLDGQQRTISIGQYVNGDFSLENRFFHNLLEEEQEKILDYNLMIYFCNGSDTERLAWFRTINIAGEELTDQELLNAVYTGPWLSQAKLIFSKTGCVAYGLAVDGGNLLNGSPIRQEYLETALSWINDGDVADYMAKHQHDESADELWEYFQSVIRWVRTTFPEYRREMRGLNWGVLFKEFDSKDLDPQALGIEVIELMEDEEVTNKKGIYSYVLTRDEKYLSLRSFPAKMKREAYERQKGVCGKCQGTFKFEQMEGDHITPWIKGGKTLSENCQMLCKPCNRRKSDM